MAIRQDMGIRVAHLEDFSIWRSNERGESELALGRAIQRGIVIPIRAGVNLPYRPSISVGVIDGHTAILRLDYYEHGTKLFEGLDFSDDARPLRLLIRSEKEGQFNITKDEIEAAVRTTLTRMLIHEPVAYATSSEIGKGRSFDGGGSVTPAWSDSGSRILQPPTVIVSIEHASGTYSPAVYSRTVDRGRIEVIPLTGSEMLMVMSVPLSSIADFDRGWWGNVGRVAQGWGLDNERIEAGRNEVINSEMQPLVLVENEKKRRAAELKRRQRKEVHLHIEPRKEEHREASKDEQQEIEPWVDDVTRKLAEDREIREANDRDAVLQYEVLKYGGGG